LNEIGIFKLPNNYLFSLIIKDAKHNGIHFYSATVLERDIKIANIENANWLELKEFLKKNGFNQYEALKVNSKYFHLVNRLREELSEGRTKKINSQERILILWKRLTKKEALDINELAIEFNVSHSQITRDIAILRRVFEYREIRYNRQDNKYELK
jgi:transcriptional antiterminator